MVGGDKYYVNEFVHLLKVFNITFSMEINWEKLCAYWFDKYTHKLE